MTLCECREKELSILQGWLEEVRISRQGKLVMVRGQSGVGKTSLLQTFTEYCKQDNSIETINFVCFADYLNMPLHPMRQWLSEFAGVQILNGDGGGSFPENKELSERIDGIALPGELTNSQIEKMQSDMLMVCKELCTAVCSSIKNEILLLIIDQFEWADALTFLVVQELCQWLSDYPVICVLSYSSLQPDTGLKCDDHLFNQIEIEPFSRNQAVCFVNAATSGETIFSEDILDLLYLNSLGMPGMLFHGINILREYHWPQDNELLQQLLTNLHPEALIKARLKSFEKKEVYLLSIAALIGMQVPLIDLQDLYHSISGIRNDVFVAGVMHKAAEEMIFRRIQSDIQERAEYIFFNDDVRQYLYAMLSDQEKSDFHLIFADSIADKQVYRAAYHYSFSNNRRKQLQYARAAYELAVRDNSMVDAAHYAVQILDFYVAARITDPQAASFAVGVCTVLYMLGRINLAKELLQQMLANYEAVNDWNSCFELYSAIGTGLYFKNMYLESLEWHQKALDLFDEHQDTIDDLYSWGMLHYYVGSIYCFLGENDQALDHLSKSVSVLTSQTNALLPCLALRMASNLVCGDIQLATNDMEDMLGRLPDCGNSMVVAQVYHFCSLLYSNAHIDYDKATRYAALSYETAERNGNILFMYSASCGQALAAFYREDYDAALDAIERTLTFSRKYSVSVGILLAHAYHALILFAMGDHIAAMACVDIYFSEANVASEKIARALFLKVKISYLYLYSPESLMSVLEEIVVEEGIEQLPLYAVFFELIRSPDRNLLAEFPQLKNVIDYERQWIAKLKINQVFPGKNFEHETFYPFFQKFSGFSRAAVSEAVLANNFIALICDSFGASAGRVSMPDCPAVKRSEVYYTKGDLLLSIADIVTEQARLALREKIISVKDNHFIDQLQEMHGHGVEGFLAVPFYGIGNDSFKDILSIGVICLQFCKEFDYLKIAPQLRLMTEQFYIAYMAKEHCQRTKDFKFDLSEALIMSEIKLTAREEEIIELVLEGASNREIGERLFISEPTVKSHIYNAYRKLGISSRMELVQLIK